MTYTFALEDLHIDARGNKITPVPRLKITYSNSQSNQTMYFDDLQIDTLRYYLDLLETKSSAIDK